MCRSAPSSAQTPSLMPGVSSHNRGPRPGSLVLGAPQPSSPTKHLSALLTRVLMVYYLCQGCFFLNTLCYILNPRDCFVITNLYFFISFQGCPFFVKRKLYFCLPDSWFTSVLLPSSSSSSSSFFSLNNISFSKKSQQKWGATPVNWNRCPQIAEGTPRQKFT